MTFTLCDECDNVHPDTRKLHPRLWVCVKFPRLEGQGFVSSNIWVEHEPFMRCSGINGGKCPCWKPIRDGQMEMGT